jgi:hypothetical protein
VIDPFVSFDSSGGAAGFEPEMNNQVLSGAPLREIPLMLCSSSGVAIGLFFCVSPRCCSRRRPLLSNR